MQLPAFCYLRPAKKKSMSNLNVPVPAKEEPAPESAAKDKPDPHPTIDGTWDEAHKECWILVRSNCTILDEIIVTPHFTSRLRNANTTEAAAELFNDPQFADIVNSLPPEHVDHLQAGDYYIAIASETESKMCVFMGTSPELNADNMALVFQYNK